MEISIAELMQRSGVGFGTSGARGLVEAMSDEVCYLYTLAFLQYLHRDGQIMPGCEVAVAGDLRPSSARIIGAVVRAVESQGYDLLYCGAIPTPAVALLGIERQIPAIMVTGSHIPDDRNGIKFNKPAGEQSGWFDEVIRTRIGSPYVIEGMLQAMQEHAAAVVGYEANGGFLQATPIELFGRILSPLPTRDALIVILAILPTNRNFSLTPCAQKCRSG